MKKVVIIGAGPSGLTAGLEIIRRCPAYQVTIVEKTGRIGGSSRTEDHAGNKIDVGGHRYFTKNKDVLKWWLDILPVNEKPLTEDDKPGMLICPRTSHIFFNGHLISYPVKLERALFQVVGLKDAFLILESYFRSRVRKLKEENLEDLYINQFGKRLYELFFERYTQKICGVPPNLVSPDWGAQRVKGLLLSDVLKSVVKGTTGVSGELEATFTDTFFFPAHGAGQMWDEAARLFREEGGELLLNSTPYGIETSNDQVTALSLSSSDSECTLGADYIISTIPVRDLVRILPAVPADIRVIAEGLAHRSIVVVGLLFSKEHIQMSAQMERRLLENTWIYVQDPSVRISRIQIFNNWSPYMVADAVNTLWMGCEFCCNLSDAIWSMPDEEIQRMCMSELRQIGLFHDIQPIDYYVLHEPLAYPCYHGAYAQIDKVNDYLRKTYTNLYCVGRNGEHKYLNMDQAMEHAFDVAKKICEKDDEGTMCVQ